MENTNVNDGTQNFSLDDDFANLLNSVNAPADDTNGMQLPDRIGELALGDFEKLLAEATGGSVANYGQFKEAVTAKEKYAELEQKLNGLQQQAEQFAGGPKYANELVQKIDEMFKNGLAEDNIYEFLKYQKLDVDNMNDEDALRSVLRYQFPSFSNEEIDEMLQEEYNGSSLKMKKAAIEARQKLKEIKVNLSEPENVRVQKIKQQEDDRKVRNWQHVMNAVWDAKENYSFNLKVGEKENVLNFALPKETRQALSIEMSKIAAMNNIPPTQEGMKHLQEIAERMIMYQHGKDILTTLIRDISSKTRQEVLGAVHNVDIVHRGSNVQNAPQRQKSAFEAQKERIAKEGMNGQWR